MIRAKKSLGQNFLSSEKILRDIVAAGHTTAQDTVLEIGPGKGALTRVLLDTGARIIAVEKDDRLIPVLREQFSNEISSGQLSLIHDDILETNLSSWNLEPTSYKLISNIPYYITGAIIRKFLAEETQPETIVLLLQKEVAERIVARDGRESLLSLSVKIYGTPKIAFDVPRQFFKPTPDVDSSALVIENITKNFFTNFLEHKKDPSGAFFGLLRAAFAQKRKQLVGNLKPYGSREKLLSIFTQCGLDPKIRAEKVPLGAWRTLAENLL